MDSDKVKQKKMFTPKNYGIDALAGQIGSRLRNEFPTQEKLNSYLNKNRKSLFKRIYRSYNLKDE